ncbi:MAG: hypothetical protein MK106_08870 [Mariniblastus sp.]|nr:hypothetical protein [Mariniblastus sp.]
MHTPLGKSMRTTLLSLAIGVLACVSLTAQLSDSSSVLENPSVGYPARLVGIVLPAPRVIAQAIEAREQQLVVRILDTYAHGTDFRYDIEFYGLEPGTFDLADYLTREDSGTAEHLPQIPVTIVSNQSTNGFPTPTPLEPRRAAFYHFYKTVLMVGGILWVTGLVALIFVGRKRKKRQTASASPKSVAERLRPLVEQAAAGTIDEKGKAELERTLEVFWRRKLNLNDLSASDLRKTLREHPQAQEMLKQFDLWLYRPGEAGNVDIDELLSPYQSLPMDELQR